MQMHLRTACVTAFVCWVALSSCCARGGTFPQLVSTQFDRKGALPSGAEKPRIVLEPIDRRALPQGAVVRQTAKAAGGRVWILTDRGAFRSTTTGFEPLEVGPRRLEPRQLPAQGGAQDHGACKRFTRAHLGWNRAGCVYHQWRGVVAKTRGSGRRSV